MEGMPLNNQGNWWKSRQALNRLFEGYMKDYGEANGGRIIRAVITVLGGCRLTIPGSMPTNPENTEALLSLYNYLCELFQPASAEAIMRKFLLELKGCRISFPDYEDLYREERNRKIRSMFTGQNYKELACIFNLSPRRIWEIVNKE